MKPILFNTEMVRAILDGRKTTTRRIMNPKCRRNFIGANFRGCPMECRLIDDETQEIIRHVDPPYRTGDILYVRETFTELCRTDKNGYTHYNESFYLYAADSPQIDLYDDNGFLLDDQRIKWHPSLHMPKEAARIFLRVTDVRAARLQDMEDAPSGFNNPFCKEGVQYECDFIVLWNRTIKKSDLDKYGWDANPWVWVISFERCEKPKEELPCC